jgi:amino acid adenylation domain-containing protein/non-ribosomal peptide synthase protein (TIGR01720 family)
MKTSNTTSYPLSSTQREVWFDQLLHPDVPLYNIGGYLRIDGPVEPTIFEKALNQMIQDNDALRLVLHKGETLPTQTFAENVCLNLDYYDFSTQKNAPQSALEWMKQEFAKPFQLYDRLLFQFALLKISAECYYWLGKYHHLIMDGWSISLNVQRVATAYNALVVGHTHRDKTRYSYLEFLKNDQAYLESKKFLQHQRYWQEKYQSVPEPLIPRRYAAQFQNQTIPSRLSMLHLQRKRYDQLKAFAQENKVSTFHVILGALYCYFVRTAARDNFVIGLPTLNRRTAAFKQTLGLFASVNPAWFRFGTNLSFVELIQAISLELQKDYRHQRFPISEINKQVGLHEQGRRQLFDITLSYEKHDYDTHFNGNRAEAVTFTNGFEQNALAVFIREFHDNKNIRVDFEYSRGAFTENEIELIKVRFEFILTEILRRPSVPLREWQLMPEAEKNQILVEFNNTAADSPGDKTIIDLFEEQADKTPDNIALVFKEQQLSYKQLNQKANQQAHHLQTLGVKPEVLVGICVERSLDMVIGLFGILKAGGAYLPLDPAYPVARLALMLEDAQVSVLLTQSTLIDGLPDTTAQLVCLDTEAEALSRFCSDNPARGLKPENLAYVIYTSGSTGRPKGVAIEHRSTVALLAWSKTVWTSEQLAGVLASTSLNFDLSVFELFVPLTQGGRVILVENALHLLNESDNVGVTLLNTVPSAINELVKMNAVPASVQIVNLAGEPLQNQLVQQLYQIETIQHVFNLYGPSEDTTYSTLALMTTGSQEAPTIGCAIANTQTYLLDSYLQPVPIGVPGELHLGGAGLARGYLNRPELTFEKFIPNPFVNLGWDNPNAKPQTLKSDRLYKTGDLARYRPDGNLEYLGRIDNQVKIRGFRIELSEIEAVLAQHSAVLETAVIVHEEALENKRLIAYLVPRPEQLIETRELRRFLQQRLPDYMIPSAFVSLDALPLTPNGKIDRRALQLSVFSNQLSEETFVAPRTQVEELLAGIWADVLSAPRVGVYDNFFELGGDSIIGIQLVSRANHAGLQLTPKLLFQHQTIADLAAVVDSGFKPQTEQGLVTGPVPLTPIQHWFFEQHVTEPDHFNQAVWLEVAPSLTPAHIETIVSALIQHHDALRLRFSAHHEQLISYNGSVVTDLGNTSLKFSANHEPLITDNCSVVTDLGNTGLKISANHEQLITDNCSVVADNANTALKISANHEQLITDNCSVVTDLGNTGLNPELGNTGLNPLRAGDFATHLDRKDTHLEREVSGVLTLKDLSDLTSDEQHTLIETTAAELQARLNLEMGPLLRVAWFKLGRHELKPNRLFIVIHHLAVDGVSWRILLEDFTTAYQHLSRGEPISLPPKTTSFQQWAQQLSQYAQSEQLLAELDYWLDDARGQQKPIPLDYPAEPATNTVASAAIVTVSLSVEQTRALLNEVPKAYRTQTLDVLLTALVQSVAQWIGEPVLLIDLEGHGREALFEELDISRTVGWFTSLFPVWLDIRTVSNPGEALKSLKEQLLRIPNKGIGYGLLRYLNSDTAKHLQTLPQALLSFNYLGQFQPLSQAPFKKVLKDAGGATQSRQSLRRYLLEITGFINDGQLQLEWTYSENCHQRATIERLAQEFLAALTAIIAHCQSPEARGYTPSDFPLANLEQAMLDKLVGRRQVQDIYPLSHTQQGMLFHTRYAPDSGLYLEQLNLTLEGVLNQAAFKQAWQQVIERHSVLRTTLVWEGLDTPLQLVYPQVKLPWVQLDWRASTPNEQQEQLQLAAFRQAEQGFDLKQAPLMRCALIQFADETHQFIWTYHHLLMDGWCLPILFNEILAFYEAFCQGHSLFIEQPRPYRDYIAWLQQQSRSNAEAFWKQQLIGFTAPTPFRVDKRTEKPAFQTHEQPLSKTTTEEAIQSWALPAFQTHEQPLSKTTTAALQSFAKPHLLTLNSLIQGAWAWLLSRYSGETEVVFGATVSGRAVALAGVESMVGLFINTLPVRVSASPDTLLLPWLQRLQAQQVEREQYSYTPLVEIQGWSEVPAGVSLFESIVVFENYPIESALREPRSGLKIAQVHLNERTNYPLALVVIPSSASSELLLKITFLAGRFEPDTISRMLGHLQRLLEGLIAHPEQKLAEWTLLTEAECHQLLAAWNHTQTDYPNETCLHHLFEAQVERTPDAIAVVFEEQSITYRDLNQKANQLAYYLQTLGVKPERRVGICIERSVEMVIGIFGILKAGGAYLPLEPAYPAARLAFMLEEAQVSVLLTQSSLTEKLPETTTQVICLDIEAKTLSQYRSENLASGVESENLAYVIYTSGSTGKPKGTQIIHQGLVNYLSWCTKAYQVAEGLGVPVHSSLGFDATITSLFSPLLVGQLIWLVTQEIPELEALNQTLVSQRDWSLVKLTPAHLEILNAELPKEQLAALCRFLILGGEALSGKSLSLWRTNAPDTRIINEYGPTETVVGCCVYEAQDTFAVNVPIGRPVANTQLYILDNCLQPVPIGVPGELHIGGVGVARGYLNRPELTAAKFIPNPFTHAQSFSTEETHRQPLSKTPPLIGVLDERGSRLYKTGDLARYLPDGNIEYLGRIDNQVKIRGFRIELGEIETVLAQHSAVLETAVSVSEETLENKRLIAYVVPRPEQLIETSELRRFLQQKLPDYMIPSAFVSLDALPLTPNGKIDRRALQLSVHSYQLSEESFVAPRTQVEELLAGIWADVLSTSQVGVYDNFFELGGHSLLATQVMSRIRDTFSVELPLRLLFESPTIAALCEHLLRAQRQEQLPPITPLNRDDSLCLSFAQQRLWFLDQLEGKNATYNMFGAVRLEGFLSAAALEQSLQAIVQRHETLRSTFPTVNGKPLVQLSVISYQLPVINLQLLPDNQQDTELQRLVNEAAMRPFDLSWGPLFRIALLQLSRNSHVLLLTMHHIISDGWSIGIFINELSQLYEAFSQGRPSPLPALSIQYVDFANWQRQWLNGDMLTSQLAYWKQQLGGNRPRLPLPTDYPRTETQIYQGARQSLRLSSQLTQALKTLSQQQNVTLFMTLLAAFKIILYRYTGIDDIIVGTPIASRNRVETEKLIGLFINTLALRTDLSGNPSFRGLLQRIREVTLGAYAHQELPFEKLVEELQPERNLSQQPIFDILFNFINTPTTALELPGLSLHVLERPLDAKFLMTLYVEEQDGVLNLQLVYQRTLFSAPRLMVFLSQYQYLLAQIVAAIEMPINRYSLVTPDSHSLLPDPSVVLSKPQYDTVPHLFLSWAERTPTHPAVSQNQRAWSYRELADCAQAIARVLLSHGVKRQQVVAVFGPRRFGLIASMIGVWLSGGVLLTLDENLPIQRQQLMLREAQAKYLLYLTELPAEAEQIKQSMMFIGLDPDTGQPVDSIDSAQDTPPLPVLIPDDAAYIFFTSGTTGIPKGVLGWHNGLSHFLNWQRQTFEVGPQDRCAQLTGLSFDVVLREIFLPLTSGATLCLPEERYELSPDHILPWLEQARISLLHTVPSLTQSWLVNVPSGVFLCSLRRIFFAGEPLTDKLVRQWRAAFPKAGEIINLYGPTETTLAKCYYRVPAKTLPGIQPLGSAIPESQALVLTENQQLCGINEPGEIVLRTPFRSLGYINAPDENQRRFVKNPFGNDEHDKLYYTGDRGRYRPDGSLEILGRLDNQIKIRGIRIELEEIETVLGQHPEILEAVVVVHDEHEKRLVAFVVPKNQQHAPTPKTLRHFLKTRLPDYMIPSAFVSIEKIPLTPNGKIDRRAIQQLSVHSYQLSKESFVAPRTPEEKSLAEIWAEVLGIEQVGIFDNFFELGGHSLLATQVVSRIHEAFSIKLPLINLFKYPTVAGLAERLDDISVAQSLHASKHDAVNAQPDDEEGVL